MGSSVSDTFSHSLQLLTTFKIFWEWSESSIHLYGGKSWEVRSLLQSKTIPSRALGSYSPTRPCSGPWWCLSATMWVSLAADPSRGWPNTSAHSPRVWNYGSPLCFSNLFVQLLCSLTEQASLAKDTAKHLSAMLWVHSRDMETYTRVGSSEQEKGCFFPGLQGRLGDEQSPTQSWSSSHAHHHCILWQDAFPVSVR